jgi:hypothetical protein
MIESLSDLAIPIWRYIVGRLYAVVALGFPWFRVMKVINVAQEILSSWAAT